MKKSFFIAIVILFSLSTSDLHCGKKGKYKALSKMIRYQKTQSITDKTIKNNTHNNKKVISHVKRKSSKLSKTIKKQLYKIKRRTKHKENDIAHQIKHNEIKLNPLFKLILRIIIGAYLLRIGSSAFTPARNPIYNPSNLLEQKENNSTCSLTQNHLTSNDFQSIGDKGYPIVCETFKKTKICCSMKDNYDVVCTNGKEKISFKSTQGDSSCVAEQCSIQKGKVVCPSDCSKTKKLPHEIHHIEENNKIDIEEKIKIELSPYIKYDAKFKINKQYHPHTYNLFDKILSMFGLDFSTYAATIDPKKPGMANSNFVFNPVFFHENIKYITKTVAHETAHNLEEIPKEYTEPKSFKKDGKIHFLKEDLTCKTNIEILVDTIGTIAATFIYNLLGEKSLKNWHKKTWELKGKDNKSPHNRGPITLTEAQLKKTAEYEGTFICLTHPHQGYREQQNNWVSTNIQTIINNWHYQL